MEPDSIGQAGGLDIAFLFQTIGEQVILIGLLKRQVAELEKELAQYQMEQKAE